MRRQDAVLVGSAGPAHKLKRAEVGRQEAKAHNPRRHLAPRQEEVLAGFRMVLEVETDSEHGEEIQGDDRHIDGIEVDEVFGNRAQGRVSFGMSISAGLLYCEYSGTPVASGPNMSDHL